MAVIMETEDGGKEYHVLLNYGGGYYTEAAVCDSAESLEKLQAGEDDYDGREEEYFNVIVVARGRDIIDFKLIGDDDDDVKATKEVKKVLAKYGLKWKDAAKLNVDPMVQCFECRLNGFSD